METLEYGQDVDQECAGRGGSVFRDVGMNDAAALVDEAISKPEVESSCDSETSLAE